MTLWATIFVRFAPTEDQLTNVDLHCKHLKTLQILMAQKGTLRTCSKGHNYYKSSDCPTCPICESERTPEAQFLSEIVAPARRALERENIVSLKKLAQYSEREILQLHGIGPSSIPKLKKALEEHGLSFSES